MRLLADVLVLSFLLITCSFAEESTPSFRNQSGYVGHLSFATPVYKLKKIDSADAMLPVRLSGYKPIYYVAGVGNVHGIGNTKVNLSFKYRVIAEADLFLGYTQIMFWDRVADSHPFKDINYNPEIFYRFYLKYHFLSLIDIGNEHKSNGRDGPDSRSLDRNFIKFVTSKKKFKIGHIKGAFQGEYKWFDLWEGNLGDNPDIGKYIGNWIARLTIFNYFDSDTFKSTELYIEFYAGGYNSFDFARGGVETGFVFDIEILRMNPRIYVQWFNGYAESLLKYNEEEHTFRLGVMIL